MSARQFTGTVVKARMHKTVIVRVDRSIRHPKYNKYIRVSRTFPVHDPTGSAKEGMVVTFEETRPLSKTKRWRIVTPKANVP
jgi:small subunit ribosomal protein S17